jgi:hypothetical protein
MVICKNDKIYKLFKIFRFRFPLLIYSAYARKILSVAQKKKGISPSFLGTDDEITVADQHQFLSIISPFAQKAHRLFADCLFN